ncbi:MAG TPA: hypothetical protein VMG55_02750, partial [Stellaceae bacterium]|nr:hypothetical protein [Stellaceae bacterium]
NGGNATLGGTGGNGGNAGTVSIGATAGNIVLGATARTEFTGTGTAIANGTATPFNIEYFGVSARGGDTGGATASVTGGTGAAVTLSAPGSIGLGSITSLSTPGSLTQSGGSILTRGGDNASGVAGSGGNAGSISVSAGGGVVAGYLLGDELGALDSEVVARGGNAPSGQGGNASSVFINGASLTLSGVNASGGASTATGGAGGTITLTTTGGTGSIAIVAFTPAATSTLSAGPSINADGGIVGGSPAGTAGSIEIDGNVIATVAATHGAGTPLLALSAVGGGFTTILVNGNMDASALGAEALSFNAHAGDITLPANIGATTAFASVFVDPVTGGFITLSGSGGGGVTHTIHTTGDQEYVNPVILAGHETLISDSGNVKFDSTIDGAFTLGITALGAVDFFGTVGGGTPLANLIVHAGSIVAGSITTTSGPTLITTGGGATLTGTISVTTPVTFGGPVIMTGDALVDTTGGGVLPTGNDITFLSTLDGAHTLHLEAGTAGAVVFQGAVGGITPLAALDVIAGGGISLKEVHTTGDQTYHDSLVLLANTTITSTTGNLGFGTIDGAFALVLSAPSGSVSLGSVGSTTKLASLGIDPAGITLTGSLYETTAGQSFGSPVVLATDVSVISDTGGVTFSSTVNGAHSLSVTATSGTAAFDGAVGGTTALTALFVDPAGIVLGGSVHTTGGQTYTSAVVLTADVAATSDGGSVLFEGTVDGAHGLSVVAGSGSAEFDGRIGGTTPLASLGVSAIGITLGAGTISTSGNQNFASPVFLASNETLISTSGGVTFGSTVDGSEAALSVSATAGTVAFNGLVGSNSPIASLIANGATISLSGASTTGVQTYTGTVQLGGTYTTSGGNFTVNGPAQLTGPVTIDPGAATLTITGSVTGTANLTVLGSGADGFGSSLDLGDGTLDLSGKTAGSVTVSGFVNLGALLTGEGGYSISFLGGGSIADPVFSNTGGVTFAGDFLFAGGLAITGETLTLAGETSITGETSGVTLGVVNQGANQFVVIADTISLTGAWNGTGTRVVAPFSPIGVALAGATAPGDLALSQTALAFLATGGTAPVLIGSGLGGPIVANSFEFDAPLTLIGSSITINGTLSQASGGLVLEAVQAVNNTLGLGTILGSVSLAGGTGPLFLQAASVTLTNSTINGDPGATNSIVTQIQFVTPPQPGPGPYTVDGFDFSPSQPPNTVPPSAPPVLVPPTNPNLSNNNPGANGDRAGAIIDEINLVIQTSNAEGQGATQGNTQGSTDTSTTGTGSLADQAGNQVGGQSGETPGETPSSSGNAKPIVPNLFLHTNNGLGGGTGGTGDSGTLSDPPSM